MHSILGIFTYIEVVCIHFLQNYKFVYKGSEAKMQPYHLSICAPRPQEIFHNSLKD